MQVMSIVDEQSEGGRYLIACARIRKIGVAVLVRRLLDVIGKDQMVLSILDDESKPVREKGDHSFRTRA